MYYKTYTEYELAKSQIFDSNFYFTSHPVEEGQASSDNTTQIQAVFHSIFLSSLLNQQTFKRDYIDNKCKRVIRHETE